MSIIQTRAKMLREFDQYIRNLNISDGQFSRWLSLGVPDGADDETLLEMAEDDGIWLNTVDVFAQICRRAGVFV